MTEELKTIMNLMTEPYSIESLKIIKKMVEKNIDSKYVSGIYETENIDASAKFFVSSRKILVNYKKMKEFLYQAQEALIYDIQSVNAEDEKLIKLLTAYRILLHELHHSKQIYNVFDVCEEDIETEIIRSLYNIEKQEYKKQLESKNKSEIIEEKTLLINNILMPHSEINPLERKAEIESYQEVLKMIKPIQVIFPKIYDDIELQMLYNMWNGYEKNTPFDKIIEIIKNNNIKYKLPYGSKNMNDFNNKIKYKTNEIERMKLGTKVKQKTIDNTYKKMEQICYKYN